MIFSLLIITCESIASSFYVTKLLRGWLLWSLFRISSYHSSEWTTTLLNYQLYVLLWEEIVQLVFPHSFKTVCLDLWLQISDLKSLTPDLWLQISDFRSLNSDLWIQITDFRFLTLDLWLQISDFRFLTSDLWSKISDFRSLTPNLWLQISDFRFLISDIWLQISDTRSLNSDLNVTLKSYQCSNGKNLEHSSYFYFLYFPPIIHLLKSFIGSWVSKI